jgi:hypothetical protein
MVAGCACAVRWTVGDVSPFGFEALRLSIWGNWRLFGDGAEYVVCVNSISTRLARELTGDVPDRIAWRSVTEDFPSFLRPHVDDSLAGGAGWKLAPLRSFPGRYELSLDNDCILWDMPTALRDWLGDPDSCLIAEDVQPCFGAFADRCGPEPRNAGIRGLPPGFDLEKVLGDILAEHPRRLLCEGDEQGLQVAAVSRSQRLHVVSLRDVTLCSPFAPNSPVLGWCGAHFVGLNAKQLRRTVDGRPAVELIRDNWLRHRERLHELVSPGSVVA